MTNSPLNGLEKAMRTAKAIFDAIEERELGESVALLAEPEFIDLAAPIIERGGPYLNPSQQTLADMRARTEAMHQKLRDDGAVTMEAFNTTRPIGSRMWQELRQDERDRFTAMTREVRRISHD